MTCGLLLEDEYQPPLSHHSQTPLAEREYCHNHEFSFITHFLLARTTHQPLSCNKAKRDSKRGSIRRYNCWWSPTTISLCHGRNQEYVNAVNRQPLRVSPAFSSLQNRRPHHARLLSRKSFHWCSLGGKYTNLWSFGLYSFPSAHTTIVPTEKCSNPLTHGVVLHLRRVLQLLFITPKPG